MSIQLTAAAAMATQKALRMRGRGVGVRLCVSLTGCSGMSYWLEFADDRRESEWVEEINGVQVLIEKNKLIYTHGIEVDYIKNAKEEGFMIKSPNQCKDECDCPEGEEVH